VLIIDELEDCAMAVAEQLFYRGDALRLGNRKQLYGVLRQTAKNTKDQFRKQENFQFWFEKQNDPVKNQFVVVARN
jgi:hypothetical protein